MKSGSFNMCYQSLKKILRITTKFPEKPGCLRGVSRSVSMIQIEHYKNPRFFFKLIYLLSKAPNARRLVGGDTLVEVLQTAVYKPPIGSLTGLMTQQLLKMK